MKKLPIPSFPGYFATDDGQIFGPYGKSLYQGSDKDGYKVVRPRKDGKYWTKKVHRLVCEAFHGIPKDPKKNWALHNDGTKTNNHPSNLRWGNVSENVQDGILHFSTTARPWGSWNRGTKHGNSKVTKEMALEILSSVPNSPRGTKTKLAKKFNISQACVTRILRGQCKFVLEEELKQP